MDDRATLRQLRALAQALYEEGYQYGFEDDEDLWLDAYALAMLKVARGAEYTPGLVIDCAVGQ